MKALLPLALFASCAYGQALVVAHTLAGHTGTVTTSAINCSSSSTIGRAANGLFVVVTDYLQNITGVVTDSSGNTYVKRTNATINGANSAAAIFDSLGTPTVSSTMTFTYTGGSFASVAPVCMWAPYGAAFLVDQITTPNNDGCGAPCSVGTITPTQPGNVIILAGSDDEVSQAPPGFGVVGSNTASFNVLEHNTVIPSTSEAIMLAVLTQSSPAAITPSMVGYVSGTTVCVSYKLSVAPPTVGTSISWQLQTPPGGGWLATTANGFWTSFFDPIHQAGFEYISGDYNEIYSAQIWNYKAGATNTFTKISDNGTSSPTTAPCEWQGGPADVLHWPGARHPYGGTAQDSKRWWMLQSGGVCATKVPPNDIPPTSTYYYDLRAQQWTKLTAPSAPSPSPAYTSWYDSDYDAWFWHVKQDFPSPPSTTSPLHVYCRTADNPTPGTLTANQTTAGCATADDWTAISTTVPLSVAGHFDDIYYSDSEARMFYDSTSHKAFMFGGCDNSESFVGTGMFEYDVPTKTWSKITPSNRPPAETNLSGGACQIPLGWDPMTRTMYYHQQSGTGAPADWVYERATNTFTKLTTSGTGPGTNISIPHYDQSTNQFVAFVNNSSLWDIYLGTINGAPIPTPITTTTVQEAIYAGGPTAGITRNNEPVCQGVPLANSAGITDPQTLTWDAGASAGQFRILGVWGSNLKWVEACAIIPSISAGGTATPTLQSNGSGNFGGGNLASLSGSTITINNTGGATACGSAGATCWTINAGAGYNVFDTVRVGTTTMVATGTSDGLVVTGPSNTGTYPNNVTCGAGAGQSACTKDYKSKNDSGATCAIENNGPVYASVRCIGNLDDGSSHVYMQYTTRSYFYKGKNYAKVQAIYRNANYDTGSTPSTDCNNSAGSCQGQTKDTAYKGYKSRELRLKFANPTSASSLSYTFGTHTGTPATGTLNQSGGTDSAYIYQGLSDSLIPPDNSCAFIPMTTWSASHAFSVNNGVLDSNGNTQFVTTAGTSGGGTPTWSTTYGGTTTDGSVVWTRTNYCSTTYSPDNGYTIAKNASATNTGTYQQYPKGWGVVSDGSGNSIQIGINQFAGYWGKSLEFNGGGTDVRVGLSASENGNPAGGPGNGTFAQYAPWPGWQMDDVFIEFNTSAPSSFDDEFQKFQAPLVLRPSTTSYINSTAVYPYPLPNPADEDALYVAASNNVTTTGGFPIAATNFCYGTTANCYPDLGATSPLITANRQLGVYHAFIFAGGGPSTQEDFRWVWALNFLKRGYTGSYLGAANFAKMLAEKGVFHADGTSATSRAVNGFHWSSRPDASSSPPEQDGYGFPIISGGTGNYCCATRATIANFQNSFMNIPDSLHDHTYHQEDFYMLTGDETIREALVPKTDYFTNPNTYQGKIYSATGGGLGTIRSNAIEMIAASLMSEYLTSIGDSTNATAAINQALLVYNNQPVNDLCVVDGAGNAWPTGCQPPPVASLSNGLTAWPGAGSAIPPYTMILDSNGNIQVASSAGGTTGSGPTWATVLSTTTTDGTVTWTLTKIGNTLPTGYDLPGISKVRGAAWAPTSRGGVWCGGQGFYRGNDLFQYSIYIEGILAVRHAQPATWTKVDYEKALDLTYGVSQFILSETYRIGGASTSWYGLPQSGASAAYNGSMVGVMYDMPQYCNSTGGNGGTPGVSYGHGPLVQFGGTGPIYDPYSLISSSQGFWMAFWPQYLVNGGLTSDQLQKMYYSMAWDANQGFHFFEDVGSYQFGALAYANANATRQLQDLSFSCLNCSGGTVNYQLQFTPPAGTCTADGCLRVKWSDKTIANSGGYSSISPTAGDGLLGYQAMDTRTWTLNPATNATFFGSNVIAEPTPTPGSSMTVTVNTATTGLLAANFSVKALNFGACTLSPSTLGPWTNTQASGFGSLVASGCTSSTYACTGLPTGLSINSSTGAITGTISAASTFTPSCTYDTATQPYTILVNAVPTVTTSGAMAAGTQGSGYSQTVATSGGTSPLACALFGGSLTGSGLTVNSNCTVTGTAGTPATYTFTVKATDSNSIVSAASSNITITINASGGSTGGTIVGGKTILGGKVIKR